MSPDAARPFPFDQLVLPTLVILISGLLVSFLVTRKAHLAVAIATIKAATFFLYFGFLFDGTFTFLDDWSYLQGGAEILSWPWDTGEIEDNMLALQALAGGQHSLYYAVNALALKAFGEGYFAPVAANIVVSVFLAAIGTHLAAREFQLIARYRAAFFAFLALHPSIFAWSNVMNGKDQLVLLLHVVLLWAGSLMLDGARRSLAWAIPLTLAATLLLSMLRFYVPFLIALALVLAVVTTPRSRRVRWLVLGSFGAAVGSAVAIGLGLIVDALSQFQESWVNPLYGLVRFLLTPVPFGTDPAHVFLDLPALIHWLLLPATIIGVRRVALTATPFSRFLLAYFVVFCVLYAAFGELQGPRHRLQLEYAVALFQFLGFIPILRMAARSTSSAKRAAGIARSELASHS